MRPRLIDARSNSGADSAANRERLDEAEEVHGAQDGIVAQPGGGAVGGGSAHVDPHHQDPLRLHAHVHVGGLAADHEVPAQSVAHQHLRTVLPRVGAFLVGDHDQLHLGAVDSAGQVRHREHHGGERGLHVVGAAPEQPPALDAGRELLGVAGDDVEVAVEDEPRRARADPRHEAAAAAVSMRSTVAPRASSQPATKSVASPMPERRDVS